VELSGLAELNEASALLQRVWRAAHPAGVASASLLRTWAHSGNYVAGAYRDRRLVGVATGFFGPGHLHSYVAGVEPGGEGRGIGYALKSHQRTWTLQRGVCEVHWTYDPLILRNAAFNLRKLGVVATDYLPEFYGPMTDGINAGDLSDRLYVRWHLDAPAPAAVDRTGAGVLVDRAGDEPLVADLVADAAIKTIAVAVPHDAQALRDQHPATALRWRHAVRDALQSRLAAGWRITGITRDGYYVLAQED